MEQNTGAGTPMTPVVENNQKSGKGFKVVTAIACVVAVCGIGFGVFGMVQSSQKDSHISELETQVLEQTADDNGTMDAGENPTNQREQGYLYLDEFGIKIKVPDDTLITSYAYLPDHYGLTYTNVEGLGTYEIWIIPKDQNDLNYSLFTTQEWAIRISRYSKVDYDCRVSCGKEIFTNEKYVFTINPQVSTIANYDGTMDEELNTTLSSFLHDQYMNDIGFFDKENYSKI